MILIALALTVASPPLGWDIGNSFAKDGCTNDALQSDAACYAAYLRQQADDSAALRALWARAFCANLPEVCPVTAAALADETVTESEMSRIDHEIHLIGCSPEYRDHSGEVGCPGEAGYPPGDARCTDAYQRRTGGEFYADDVLNCRRLRPIHWITLEDNCTAAAPERNVVVTDEIHPPIACPEEPTP